MDDSALNLDAYFAPSDPDTWRQHVEATLKGRPFEKLIRPTPDGFGIEPLYTAPPEGYTPGEANHPPFIRGARTADRRRAGWDIRALHDMGDPTTTAQAIADDLERGVHSLWLVPAHHDRPGLALFTAAGLNEALSAVEATRVAIYLDPGPHGGAWFATLLAMAHMRGLDPSNLQGAILYDPLGTLAHTGHLPQGFDAAWHALAVLTAQATTHAPALRTVGLSGLPYHHAGASAAQELAAVMATAIATFRHLEAHNIAPETVAAQSVLQFAVGSHMFMDIAKLRAARLLWSRILTACGVKPNAPELHVCTSPADLTRRDPWVNILRGTAGCFAAAVAGADAITVMPFDRALGQPDPSAARIASNTQVVLEAESHLTRVADPAGGSWAIEHLTHTLAQKAWDTLQAIEAQGGMVQALTSGWLSKTIAATSEQHRLDVAKRKRALVGVSMYANPNEAPLQRPQPQVHPPDAQPLTLEGDNLAERLLSAISAGQQGASVPSLAQALHPDAAPVAIAPLPQVRHAAPWEVLRDASDRHQEVHGHRPRVFLANLGSIPEHKARAGFAQRLFEAGGFEVITNDGFTRPEAIAEAFATSQAHGAAICGTDQAYQAQADAVAAALHQHHPAFITLAGRPGDDAEAWQAAGVTHYAHLGCDALALLVDLHSRIEPGS